MGAGGNLSPGMLISAYRQGIFPWYDEEPILWWSPDPRFVIYTDEIHVSRSMRRILRRSAFDLRMDTAFARVIHACATTPRPGQRGTWITREMEAAYDRLHELGLAHSCEAWIDDQLVGGIYGVSVGRMFFGESMFSHRSNASKAALITLTRFLRRNGYPMMDVQMPTPHLKSMGGREIARAAFVAHVRQAVDAPPLNGSWRGLLADEDRLP